MAKDKADLQSSLDRVRSSEQNHRHRRRRNRRRLRSIEIARKAGEWSDDDRSFFLSSIPPFFLVSSPPNKR
ncbi:hypothetical protein EUGRSUZ_L02720 [Eucalyptus grandis]|uniref:Uncharacterized protein n=1 Tax=Eucalyptus grandis TaxID=71139 RepID=A0AAD9WIT2_EUCGR|nr:hypothetical protein EUGRSUZ_L02720 [Eucalyptus grandis]